jgi:hypothetical protein
MRAESAAASMKTLHRRRHGQEVPFARSVIRLARDAADVGSDGTNCWNRRVGRLTKA